MTCSRCGKELEGQEQKCPHCGAPTATAGSGVYQSSTVLISADGTEVMYRSMDEVPDPLRNRLLKSTNSPNSATILIADRRGRQEIAKAMRNLSGTRQRHLMQSFLGGAAQAGTPGWLTPAWKKVVFALVLTLTILLVSFVFMHRW